MPESVRDRCTKAHEYIFLMTKSAKYYYDAEAIKENGSQNKWGKYSNPKYGDKQQLGGKMQSAKDLTRDEYIEKYRTRNKRSVWTVATQPYSEAHFATFPPKLIEPCILAGTSERGCCPKCGEPWERVINKESTTTGWQPGCSCNAGDPVPCVVLDIFFGTGTVGAVCVQHGRNYIGIELNKDYIRMAERRIERTKEQFPLFNPTIA